MKRGREEKNPKALSDINLAECVGYELKFILIASNYGAEEGEQPESAGNQQKICNCGPR